MHVDTVVIGTGPGGEGAAMKLCKDGGNQVVIEERELVGGNCTHVGTIPSKALRHAVQRLLEIRQHPLMMQQGDDMKISLGALWRTADQVIKKQVVMRHGFYERNGVRLLHGRATFVDAHTVEVTRADGGRDRITADHFILATGSRPYRPDNIDFSHPRIFDSDTIRRLEEAPKSMTIYGAGVIGCEYASIFRAMGVKINLVNTRENLLSFLDDEISDALSYHLRDQGVIIRHNETYAGVDADANGVVLRLDSGKQLRSDVFLWANGRTGNSDHLGLEALGVECDKRGSIKIDEAYRSTVPHIYAVGDVIGAPALASAAYDQGRFAATHLLTGNCEFRLVQDVPTGIYTTPEISCLGRTERELTEAKIPYEVGHSLFRSLARAQITGQTVGMLKLLFHRDTHEILGIHCFGDQASEIIHIGQAIMAQPSPQNRLDYFISTTFNYPTMAEAYRVAALNGLNRLF